MSILTPIITYFKPTKNFRITDIHNITNPIQIGNVFYAITKNNPDYSLKFTIIKATNRYIKVQYTKRISEYFANKKINEYDKSHIQYFDSQIFTNQIAQLN